MRYPYNLIDVGQPHMLRGTLQQTDAGLLWLNPSYKAHQRGGTPAQTTFRLDGMGLQSFALHNRAAASIVAGIGVRIPNRYWITGQWTNATTTFTDDTASAQNTTTDDFELDTTSANDGYIIASRVPFNAVSLNISTADVGSPVRAARFSNTAGTGWQTAESNIFAQTGASANYTAGEAIVAFAAPSDWGKSVGLATGLGDGYYTMAMRSTTAPGTSGAIAKAVEIFRLYYLIENLGDNAVMDKDFGSSEIRMAGDDVEGYVGDALVALFSTANDQNRVTASVRPL